MVKEKALVLGLGEVGRPLFDLLMESGKFEVYGFDVDAAKMRDLGQTALPENVDVMHVCIPCTRREEFVESVAAYVEHFRPKLVIINSTIPPGTSMEIYNRFRGRCFVAHSPIRGVHKSLEHMKWELRRWIKYIGAVNIESAKAAKKHFEELNLKTKVLKSSSETELAKLFETIYRAWMIVCFQEMHRISRCFKADFEEVVDFLEDTHRVRLDRPVMFPGVIGGHCIIPNVELLLNAYDSELLRLILKSNEKRKREMEDENIRVDVKKIKRRVETLERELTTRKH